MLGKDTNDMKREQAAKPNAGVARPEEVQERLRKMQFDEKKQSEKVRQKFGR
jgi:hypothetical protein